MVSVSLIDDENNKLSELDMVELKKNVEQFIKIDFHHKKLFCWNKRKPVFLRRNLQYRFFPEEENSEKKPIIFTYYFLANKFSQTEQIQNFRCPFCRVKCNSFTGLECHLILLHDHFFYQFNKMKFTVSVSLNSGKSGNSANLNLNSDLGFFKTEITKRSSFFFFSATKYKIFKKEKNEKNEKHSKAFGILKILNTNFSPVLGKRNLEPTRAQEKEKKEEEEEEEEKEEEEDAPTDTHMDASVHMHMDTHAEDACKLPMISHSEVNEDNKKSKVDGVKREGRKMLVEMKAMMIGGGGDQCEHAHDDGDGDGRSGEGEVGGEEDEVRQEEDQARGRRKEREKEKEEKDLPLVLFQSQNQNCNHALTVVDDQYKLLRERQFFHSRGCQPMDLEYVLSKEEDSEDDVDENMIRYSEKLLMDEFVDVAKEEKEIMLMWNNFVREYRVLVDSHVGLTIEEFTCQHESFLSSTSKITRCFSYFLIKLWNCNLINQNKFEKCLCLLNKKKISSRT